MQYNQQKLADLIHAQMLDHYWYNEPDYEVRVSKGFRTLSPVNYSGPKGEKAREFRIPVSDKSDIRNMLFTGFSRCLFPVQKFDSDSERQFAVLLESEPEVLKWFKPAPDVFQIDYAQGQNYEPDFVVETTDRKFLCETKRADEIKDDTVQAKARAAVIWCQRACGCSDKPWAYLLIPHDAIRANSMLEGLAKAYSIIGD